MTPTLLRHSAKALLPLLTLVAWHGRGQLCAQSTWDGSEAVKNWSEILNWSTEASPAGTNVIFNATGIAPEGTTTSIVDQSISIGSLTVNYSSTTARHTLEIAAGQTLTQTGAFSLTGAQASQEVRFTVTGDGSWVINAPAANFSAANAVASRPLELDLSGLAVFEATVADFNVGTTSVPTVADISLAKDSTIIANNIRLGGSGGTGTLTGSRVLLGEETTLQAANIIVGTGRTTMEMRFQSGLTDPLLTIRGKAGGDTRANLILGANISSSPYVAGGSSSPNGLVDLRGGAVDMMLNELVVGLSQVADGANGVGYGKGTFQFDEGTIDVTRLYIGRVLNIDTSPTSNQGSQAGVLHASFNMEGGTLIADSISIAHNEDGTAGVDATSRGLFTVSGGTIQIAGDLTMGSHTAADPSTGVSQATATLTGGVITVGGNITEGAGNNDSTLNLAGATLDLQGGFIQVDAFNAASGMIRNLGEINGGATGLQVTGGVGDVLVLEGLNSYTGGTSVGSGARVEVGSGGLTGNLGQGQVALQAGAVLAFNRSNRMTVDNVISGNFGSVEHVGTGRTILTADNSYAGETLISAGILQAAVAGAVDQSRRIVVEGGAAFYFLTGSGGTLNLTEIWAEPNLELLDGSAVGVELGGTISSGTMEAITEGTVQLRLFGNSTLVSPSGSFTLLQAAGGLADADYELLLYGVTNFSATLNAKTATAISVTTTSLAELPDAWWVGGRVAGHGSEWAVSTGSLSNWASDVGGTASAVVPGASTNVHLSAGAGDSSSMTLGADMMIGTLEVADTGAVALTDLTYGLSIQGNNAITVRAGPGLVNFTTNLTLNGAAPVVLVEGARELELFGVLSGNGLTKTGSGTLRLLGTGNNAYSGTLSVHEGLVELGKTGLAEAVTGGLVIGDGTGGAARVRLLGGGQISDTSDVSLGSDGTLDLNGFGETIDGLSGTTGALVTSLADGTVTLTLGADGEADAVFAGAVQDGGSGQVLALVKVGDGTQTLSGTGSYTGGLTVLDGVFRALGNGTTGSGIVSVQGATAELDTGTATQSVTQLNLLDGALISGGGTLNVSSTIDVESGAIQASLAGAAALNKTTTGTVTLSGVNSYSGGTNIFNGTLALDGAGTLPTGTAVVMGLGTAGATLDLGNTSQSIGTLNVNTTTEASPNQIIVAAGQTLTVTGNIQVGPSATTSAFNGATTRLNMTGGGSLVVNNDGGTIRVAVASGTNIATKATWDLSGLSSFSANLGAAGSITLGQGDNQSGLNSAIILAENNSITAGSINIAAGSSGAVQSFIFGSGDNVIRTNTFNVATGGRDRATVKFDDADTTGTISISGVADGTRTTLNIATGGANTGLTGESTVFDLGGHEANLFLNALNIATQPRASTVSATFTFDEGSLDVNTMTIGVRGLNTTPNGATGTRTTNATVNLGGGTTIINEGILAFGRVTGTTPTAQDVGKNRIVNAFLNIYGDAVVEINAAANGTAISMAGAEQPTNANGSSQANATISITDTASVTVRGNIVKEGGVGQTSATLILDGGSLDMTGHSIQVDTLTVTAGTLAGVSELLDGAGAARDLVKTSAGLLVLDGLNTYTGATRVVDGTLQVGSGSLAGTLGAGEVSLESVTSQLIFHRSGQYVVTQDISGLGGVQQTGSGRTILRGTNTYSGGTVVTSGILEVGAVSSLGTGGLEVSGSGAFYYLTGATTEISAIQTASFNQTLDWQGGALGLELGQTLDFGAAATTAGDVELRLIQNAGQSINPALLSGGLTYDLVRATGGLNTADSYRLLLFNVTNYLVSLNSPTATNISVTIEDGSDEVAELAYWFGGAVEGYENVWGVTAVDPGGSISNWGVSAFGVPNLATVPGATTQVVVMGETGTGLPPEEMSLGAAMEVKSVRFTSEYLGANHPLTLRDANFGLTISGKDDAGATLSVATGTSGAVTIDLPRLTLLADGDGAPVVDTEDVINRLEIIANLNGDAIIKRGAGWLTLSGSQDNTYTGVLTVEGGVLELNKTSGMNAITSEGLDIAGGTVRLLASDQIADDATVNVETGAVFSLNGFNETIGGLTGPGTVNNGAAGAAVLSVGGGNVSSAFDGLLTNGSTGTLALTKVGTGTLTLNRANTYTGLTTVQQGVLQYGTNNAIAGGAVTVSGGTLDMNGFSDTVGVITVANGGRIVGDGSVLTSSSTRQMQDGEVSVRLAGSGALNKTTSGTVILSGDNTYTGSTSISTGVLRITSNRALGSVSGTTTINGGDTNNRLELSGGIVVSENVIIGARSGTTGGTAAALSSIGNNTWAGGVSFTTGGSNYNIESQSGLFTISGNVSGRSETTGSSRFIQLMGAGDGIISGSISDGPGAARSFHLHKMGTGTWTLAGANTYTGATDVQQGTLKVTHSGALAGTSILTVRNGANFAYLSGLADNDLQVADLTLQGNNRLGVELGNQINVTGAASVTGSIVVDVYGISGAAYSTGQHVVMTAASGLNGGTYTLGTFYNLTNFTVDGVDKNDTSVWLNVTSVAAPLTPFYWKGGFAGGENVWAITNGLTTGGQSNWATDLAGTDTPLVPGETADVIFSVTSPTNQADPMVLGASMSIGTLTFNNAGEVWLDDQANTLTLHGASALTVNSGAGLVRLNTNLIFNHAAAMVHVAAGEELGLGAVKGTNGFTKTGEGTLRFIGGTNSTATGAFIIEEGLTLLDKGEGVTSVSGDLEIGVDGGTTASVISMASHQIADAANVRVNTGSLFDLNGYSESMGALSGAGTFRLGGEEITELVLGTGNASGVFSGTVDVVSGVVNLTKLGTGSQTLTSFFGEGTLRVDNGELRLTNGGSVDSLYLGIGNGASGAPVKLVVEGGTFSVGSGAESTFQVGRSGVNLTGGSAQGWGELDLSAASQFNVNVGDMLIGVEISQTSTAFSVGVLKLATNSDITAATQILVGRSPGAGNHSVGTPPDDTPVNSRITFGSGTSTVRTPVFTIGGFKSQAIVDVAAGGTVIIEGLDGGTANLYVGRNDGNTGTTPFSTADFSAGSLQATLGSLIIGDKTGGGVGTVKGTLILGDSGANDVTVNSVIIGNLTSALDGAGLTTGELKIGGGTFNVSGSVVIGNLSGSFGTVSGLLEITGGEVTVAGNITTNTDSVRSTSTVELDGGTLNMANGYINVDNFIARSGVLSQVSQLWRGVPSANFSNLANVADLNKTSTGVLRLESSNGYTGGTNVNEGVFLVNGTHAGAGSYTVASGATLGGRGTLTMAADKNVTIQTGGTLSVGDEANQAATLGINLTGSGALVFETGSTVTFDLISGGGHGTSFSGRSDVLDVSGNVNIGTDVTFEVLVDPAALGTWAWTVGDTWQLIDWTAVTRTGTFTDYVLPDIASLGTGLDWDVSNLHVDGTISIYAVPEPSRALLLLAGLLGLSLRRRRR